MCHAAAWAGDTAVTSVEDATVKLVADTDPKCTAVAPDSSAPNMSTLVPPAVGPVSGETEVTEGLA